MKYLLIILLSFLGLSGYGQLMQTNGTPGGYQFVALKGDSLIIIPRGIDTPAIGPTKYGKSTAGALFYKTTDSTFWVRSSNKWNRISGSGGGGGVQSVTGNSPIDVDNTDPNNPIISYTGDTTRVFIFESPIQALTYGDTIYVYFDTTLHNTTPFLDGRYYPLTLNPAGYLTQYDAQGQFMDTSYTRNDSIFGAKSGAEFLIYKTPASAGGGISEVIGQWGLINVNDSTLKADSFNLATKARVLQVADSIQVVNAATYAPLIRTISTGWGIYGGGDFSINRTHIVDSFLVVSRDRLLKVIDSLVAIIATKQATGNYITALTGDVTASGPGSVAATLATVNSNVGSFTNANITVNGKGLITAASNGSSGGSAAISALTLATATNTIDNTSYAQHWRWGTLAGATALKLSSNATTAASNLQTILEVADSGANATGTQTTTAVKISNIHTGTTSTNIGLDVTASGGTNNYAAVFTGKVGIGTTTPVTSAALDITSTTGALVLPRMTATQQNAISTPIAGDLIYNTTENAPTFHNGTLWSSIAPVLLKYGNNLNNVRSWNGGSVNAAANLVGSSGTTITAMDSVNRTEGFESGNDLTSGYRNFFQGTYSGRKATTAFSNIGIGHRTMGAMSGAAFTGSGNIGIGMQLNASTGNAPLALITSGVANTAMGSTSSVFFGAAGSNVTTGSNNSFYGASAGYSVNSGTQNTLIGVRAGEALTTVSSNTMVGYLAANTATTANNTIFGATAGGSLTGAGTLDAFGFASGYAITTGLQNLSFGQNALGGPGGATGEQGSYNVALGVQAMAVQGSGSTAKSHNRNVMIGYSAGQVRQTAANDNVMIGYSAGIGVITDSIRGSNNIALGAASLLPSLTTDNQFTVWHGATGGTGGYNTLTRFTGGGWLFNNTTSAVTSATVSTALEVNGTTGGILFPRLNVTQAGALTTPPDGLVIYVTNTDATFTAIGFWGRVSGAWAKLN